MNCTICGKKIVLIPSAAERVKKYGGTEDYYRRLFTTHSECAVRQRSQASIDLMRQLGSK